MDGNGGGFRPPSSPAGLDLQPKRKAILVADRAPAFKGATVCFCNWLVLGRRIRDARKPAGGQRSSLRGRLGG